jgi:hypothetical protein
MMALRASHQRAPRPVRAVPIDGLMKDHGISADLPHPAARVLPPLLAFLTLWGCSSTPDAALAAKERLKSIPPLPCLVCVVLPESPQEEAEPEGSPQGTLRLDPDRLAKSIESEFRDLRVSTDVRVVTRAEAGSPPGSSDEMEGIDANADLLLEIEPAGPPAFGYAYRNGWFLPNTFLWFLLGFPSFWIADRVYDVRWDVTLKVSRACARGQPQTVRLSLETERALSLSDQGWTATALYTPPGFYEGPQVSRSLTHLVEGWLVEELVGFLKSESGKPGVLALLSDVEIRIESPENLSMVSPGEAVLSASIASSTLLERLRIEVDGEPVLERSPLNMLKASRRVFARSPEAGAFEYKVRLPIHGSPGEHSVRVFALRSGEPAVPGLEHGRAWSVSRSIRFMVSGEAAAPSAE